MELDLIEDQVVHLHETYKRMIHMKMFGFVELTV